MLGCVYNGVTPEPFTLPLGQTRSGIRTRSTPRSDGFNELSFEDEVEREQVYLRAQRDYDSFVRRDRTANVHRDDRETIAGSQAVSVGGDRTLEVQRNQEVTVQGDVREVTTGAHDVQRTDLVSHILQERTDYIDGTHETQIRGSRASHVRGWSVDRVDGNATQLVGHGAASGHWAVDVKGDGSIHSGSSISLRATDDITLTVGKSVIRIGTDQIEVSSPTVVLRGKDARILLADGECKVLTKTKFQVVSESQIVLRSAGASIGLQSQAQIAGSQILLNPPTQATDSFTADELTHTSMVLTGSDGQVMRRARFAVRFDDGSVFSGVTDDDGNAVIEGAGHGEIEFPDHTNPTE